MQKLSCLVVDDDPLSIKVLSQFINKTNFLQLAGEHESAIAASNALREIQVDLIFLDIRMPEMSGMELVKCLEGEYEVILVTSEREHALEAIELDVTDYLVKPVIYPRFLKAVNKAKQNIKQTIKLSDAQKDIYVKTDARIVKIDLVDILFIEALSDYVIINTSKKRHIVHSTMKGIERKMPAHNFTRVHRSYIVNCDKIDSMEDLNIQIGHNSIPIGPSYKSAFLDKLNFL